MASRGGWPSYSGQAGAQQDAGPVDHWGLQSDPLDMPQRGRQVHREPPGPFPAHGSWQQDGGPGALSAANTRSLSAPPADLAARWAAGQAEHTRQEARAQPGGWQHPPGAQQEPSTHFASQVLPLLAEAPAQPSPSSLLPVEQQQWLRRRLEQAQQQLARQRHEQAEWAAAAAQLLRGRVPPQPPARLSSNVEEPWCPTCRASGQDSTEPPESQQLEELIDGLEIEMEQQLEELQRRQRWAAQHPHGHQPPGQQLAAHQLLAHHQQQLPMPHPCQLPPQPAGHAWELRRQERELGEEQQVMLRLNQDQWQLAAAAAMQRQPHGGQPLAAQQLAAAYPFGGSGYSAPEGCPAPVRLSAPARMEQHRQVSFGTESGTNPDLLLHRAWQQQQQQRQQSWQQSPPPQQQQQAQQQQRQHSWQPPQPPQRQQSWQPPQQPQQLGQQQQRQHSWQPQQPQPQQAELAHQLQTAPQRFDPAGQPWEQLTRTGAQLQAEQQQWAAHAQELLARSSAGPAPGWR